MTADKVQPVRRSVRTSELLCTDRQASVLASSFGLPRAYSPYGGLIHAVDTLSAYTGQMRDPFTGGYLLGNGHRVYNPVLMRFHSPDKLSPFDAGGINAYAYCSNDPINHVDPQGQFLNLISPIRSLVAGALNLSISAVKAFRNYRMQRDFDVNTGFAASRSGDVTYNTAEAHLSPWSMGEKVQNLMGGGMALASIVTASMRVAGDNRPVLMWVDTSFALVATVLSVLELYGLASEPIIRRYPVQNMNYIRNGSPETPV